MTTAMTATRRHSKTDYAARVGVGPFDPGRGHDMLARRKDGHMQSTKSRMIVCTGCQAFIQVIGKDADVDKALRRVDWETGPYFCRDCNGYHGRMGK